MRSRGTGGSDRTAQGKPIARNRRIRPPLFLACCPFKVSWWAVSFPLAATAIAAIRYAAAQPSVVTDGFALALLVLATLTISGLLVRTFFGVVKGDLRALSA